jgi:glucosamine--fructose-6-phosphate aminotransferase (isomerizing)
MLGRLGMGHTRWATHGKPSKENAHPHQSANGQVVLVHNGIMENHAEKREFLKKQGYAFASETDSETLANLLAYLFQSHNEDPIATLVSLFREAKGAYALVIHFQSIPDALFAVRKESPLLIGQGEGEMLLASDSAPLLPHTK